MAASLPAEDGDGSNRTISADPADDLADGNLLDTSSATPRPSRVQVQPKDRTVDPARMIAESLTPKPGIREHNRHFSDVPAAPTNVRFQGVGSIGQCNTACSLSAGVSKPKVFRGR